MKIGVFGDIHEDVTSLARVLSLLEKKGCKELVCLGDIVGFDAGDYGRNETRDAETCIRLVREHCSTVVIGNHDLFAIKQVPSYTAGFDYPDHWYTMNLAERQKRSAGVLWDYCVAEDESPLSDNARTYLRGLPEFAVVSFADRSCLFSHHLFPDLSGSKRKMPQWLPDAWHHLRWMRTHDCVLGISGHTHLKGTLTATWGHFSHTGNQTLSLNCQRRWVTCPPVTQGPVPSGCLILNTEENTVSIHYLDSFPAS